VLPTAMAKCKIQGSLCAYGGTPNALKQRKPLHFRPAQPRATPTAGPVPSCAAYLNFPCLCQISCFMDTIMPPLWHSHPSPMIYVQLAGLVCMHWLICPRLAGTGQIYPFDLFDFDFDSKVKGLLTSKVFALPQPMALEHARE